MTESKIQPEDFEFLQLPPGWEMNIASPTKIIFSYQHYYVPIEAHPQTWVSTYSKPELPDQKPGFVVHKTRNNTYFIPRNENNRRGNQTTDDHDTLFTHIKDACYYQQRKIQRSRIRLIESSHKTFPMSIYRRFENDYETYYTVLKEIAENPTEINGIGPKRAAYILFKQKAPLPTFTDTVCMVSCPNCTFAWWQFPPKQYGSNTLEHYNLLHCPSCNHDTFTHHAISPYEIPIDAFDTKETLSSPQSIAPYTSSSPIARHR